MTFEYGKSRMFSSKSICSNVDQYYVISSLSTSSDLERQRIQIRCTKFHYGEGRKEFHVNVPNMQITKENNLILSIPVRLTFTSVREQTSNSYLKSKHYSPNRSDKRGKD